MPHFSAQSHHITFGGTPKAKRRRHNKDESRSPSSRAGKMGKDPSRDTLGRMVAPGRVITRAERQQRLEAAQLAQQEPPQRPWRLARPPRWGSPIRLADLILSLVTACILCGSAYVLLNYFLLAFRASAACTQNTVFFAVTETEYVTVRDGSTVSDVAIRSTYTDHPTTTVHSHRTSFVTHTVTVLPSYLTNAEASDASASDDARHTTVTATQAAADPADTIVTILDTVYKYPTVTPPADHSVVYSYVGPASTTTSTSTHYTTLSLSRVSGLPSAINTVNSKPTQSTITEVFYYGVDNVTTSTSTRYITTTLNVPSASTTSFMFPSSNSASGDSTAFIPSSSAGSLSITDQSPVNVQQSSTSVSDTISSSLASRVSTSPSSAGSDNIGSTTSGSSFASMAFSSTQPSLSSASVSSPLSQNSSMLSAGAATASSSQPVFTNTTQPGSMSFVTGTMSTMPWSANVTQTRYNSSAIASQASSLSSPASITAAGSTSSSWPSSTSIATTLPLSSEDRAPSFYGTAPSATQSTTDEGSSALPTQSNSTDTALPVASTSKAYTVYVSSKNSSGSASITSNTASTASVAISTSSLSASSVSLNPPSNTSVADFVLHFDDLPSFTPSNNKTDITQAPPVFSPYRHLFFSQGFVYAPLPEEPYIPHSAPHLAVFIPNAGGMSASTVQGGEISDGPYEALSAFWFNARNAWLGCDNVGPEDCTVVVTVSSWNPMINNGIVTFKQNITVPPCAQSSGCALQRVRFPAAFQKLSKLQMQAFVGQEERKLFVDDIGLTWWNQTREADQVRADHP